ncbi:hypothetical protein ACSBR2_018601 [Camellia fascicularis]
MQNWISLKITAKLLISNLFFYTNNVMRSSSILPMNSIQILRIENYSVIYLKAIQNQHWVRRDCLEAYHAECVAKDESFVESGNSWTCKWHSCFICCKSSKFHCFCCLKAVCQHCIATAEFARVRRNKGFCNHYLKFALLREENMDVNSDGIDYF